jgi:chromosomal replication initiation ATPase DnaA
MLEPVIPDTTWDRVLGRIEAKVPPHSFKRWFKPTQCIGENADSLTIRVPNDWFAEWLEANYGNVIRDALREAEHPELSVEFQPLVTGPAKTAAPEPVISNAASRQGNDDQPPLNPRYTFSTFVVSSSPTFSNSCSCKARNNLPCNDAGISPTSSRNNVPPFASCRRPTRSLCAPVNAPRT